MYLYFLIQMLRNQDDSDASDGELQIDEGPMDYLEGMSYIYF